jgi:hypothetical protein
MTDAVTASRFDRARLALLADWLAVCVAVSLPWSTSATAICILVWLLVLLPTLNAAALRRELDTAAGGLPVALWFLAALGMLWADVSWSERINGLGGFHRLLMVPLLLAQFRRSQHGAWVLYGFLCSATVLLFMSWALVLLPGLDWRGKMPGVPVKDYIFQSTEFLICAFALIERACNKARERNLRTTVELGALAAVFLANIAFVATSRTVLLVAPVLIVLLGWRHFGLKGTLAACLIGGAVSGLLWLSSPYLRERVTHVSEEVREYRADDAETSAGLRLEFWKKSIGFVAEAPLIGHGTGTIADQFRRAAVGKTGAVSVASVNPHNQTFAVAIQLGLIGAAFLLAMWAAHFCLFLARGPYVWIGTVVVVENVVSSLFNSHLFDFASGWLYVFGVGVVGGMVLRSGHPAAALTAVAER